MFCGKCGKEVQEGWSVCPQCGNTLVTSELKQEMPKQEFNPNMKPKKKSKVPFVILVVVIMIVMLFACSDGSEEQGSSKSEQVILDELATFTTLYKDDSDRYIFLDKEEKWAICYTDANEFVVFENEVVLQCFTDAFGYDCFADDILSGIGFSYDLDENAARTYFDVDISEGHLTIVNYSFTNEEYVLNVNGDKYEASDEFVEFVQAYGLAEDMQSDVDEFKEVLSEHDLSMNDLLNLEYETIDEQFVPAE